MKRESGSKKVRGFGFCIQENKHWIQAVGPLAIPDKNSNRNVLLSYSALLSNSLRRGHEHFVPCSLQFIFHKITITGHSTQNNHVNKAVSLKNRSLTLVLLMWRIG